VNQLEEQLKRARLKVVLAKACWREEEEDDEDDYY